MVRSGGSSGDSSSFELATQPTPPTPLGRDDESDTELYTITVLTAVYILHERNGMRASCLKLRVPFELRDVYEGRTKALEFDAVGPDGVSLVRERVRVPLGAALETHRFTGAGDHSPFTNMARGDLEVAVEVASHPLFHVDTVLERSDLFATVPVSLYDFYYGRSLELRLPDRAGTEVRAWYRGADVSFDSVESGGAFGPHQTLFEGAGLPRPDGGRGDLYVYPQLRLPTLSPSRLRNPLIRVFLRVLFG